MFVNRGADLFVIVNGVFAPELSSKKNLPKGITVTSLAEAVESIEAAKKHYGNYATGPDAFISLNTAMNEGGVFVHIAKNAVSEEPLHLLHITDNETEAFFQPRLDPAAQD